MVDAGKQKKSQKYVSASSVAERQSRDESIVSVCHADDALLAELGYKSEFRRDMSLFGVLGISFCAIGILTGMSSAFQTGLFSGGPLGLFWGWNVRARSLCMCEGLTSGVARGRSAVSSCSSSRFL